jgi:hypothetical protein
VIAPTPHGMRRGEAASLTMGDPETESIVNLKAGDYVYRPGDPAAGAFLIESGEIVLLYQGQDESPGAQLGPGEVFGGVALACDDPRDAGARAETDAVLLRIDRQTFPALVARYPEIAAQLVGKLSLRCERRLPQGAPQGPTEKDVPVAACLVHASGAEFPLPLEGEALVGRADPEKGYQPHVELSSFDAQRSLSRRHARLFREGRLLYVQEEPGVRNGTFVNGRRIKAGERVPVNDRDEIAFGLIKTTLRLG